MGAMNMKTTFLAIAAFAVVALGSMGQAHANKWDTIGAACVPDAATVQSGKLYTGGHGVSFVSGQTGTLRLICGLSLFPNLTFSSFNMYYTDPDGASATYSISVSLRTALQNSTSSTNICSVVSSNLGTSSNNCDFSDFTPDEDYRYWYEVLLTRTSSASNPEFLGIKTN
jgi:hypothetical protein